MTLADKGMTRQAFGVQYLAAFHAVADVGEVSGAVDVGGVAAENADVMKHRRLGDEVSVDFEAAAANALKSLVSHFGAVNDQRFIKSRARAVVFFYDLYRIHQSLFDNLTPAVSVLLLAELDGAELVVELCGFRSRLAVGAVDELAAVVEVVDLADG